MYVLGVMAARGGSKQIPAKHLRHLCGKPLIGYTIECALNCGRLDDFCISTDSEYIAAIAESLGVNQIIDRPTELASDTAHSGGAIRHALQEYENATGRTVDAVVNLFATYPLRTVNEITGAVDAFIANQPAKSLTTVHEVDPRTHYYLCRPAGNQLSPLMGEWPPHPNRQDYEPLYEINGVVEVCARQHLLETGIVRDEAPLFHVIPSERILDINHMGDWRLAEILLANAFAPVDD